MSSREPVYELGHILLKLKLFGFAHLSFFSFSYLSVFAEVQRPQVCLLSCDMYIEKVYLGVPVSREVVLHNQSLLRAQYKWKEVSAEIKAYSAIAVAGVTHTKLNNPISGR